MIYYKDGEIYVDTKPNPPISDVPVIEMISNNAAVITPRSFDDISDIASACDKYQSLMICTKFLDLPDRKRIVDFCAGMVFAKEGTLKKLEENIFMLCLEPAKN